MKPLEEDQIHAPAFIKECDYIWSDDVSRANKSGVWEYYTAISKEFNKPLIDHTCMPSKGIIFVGMCHILEDILNSMPTSGSYVIVHRTNDRPFTQRMVDCMPPSVQHIYTVDCQVKHPRVTAIPFGLASINGEDNLVKQIVNGGCMKQLDSRLFVCYNTNVNTPHRNESIPILKTKSFAKVIELNYPTVQVPADEFYKHVHSHEFTMALAGCGADASRQWASIILGSIPIVTDCPEMRHFEDLPLVYCPKDMNDITDEWLNKQADLIKDKSTQRMRMSYWANELSKWK